MRAHFRMNLRPLLSCLAFGAMSFADLYAGTLTGHVRDLNWFARRVDTDPFGVGQYEYAVNANGTNISPAGGADDTDVFGAFSMPGLPGGSYTVASWDVWWRSAYAFNVSVPASGSSGDADVRL